jgi:hypothetical protein
MEYQLVLQFQGDGLSDYDALIGLEDELIDALGDDADVDGHDIGSGEVNIFIFTSEPEVTFQRASFILKRLGLLSKVVAAHRSAEADDFTVIWPSGASQDFSLA